MTVEVKRGSDDQPTVVGEVSGAFGDLGMLLPYLVATLAAGLLAPTPVLLGLGAAYAVVAVVYRAPIAVQPMKAIGAMILAGGLGAQGIAWAGAIVGAALLGFAALPALGRAARAIPQSVVTGLQAGLGLMLLMLALRMMGTDWRIAAPALGVLSLAYVWRRGPWALVVVVGAVALAPVVPGMDELAGPDLQPPMGAAHPGAVAAAVAAQLPLTLLNAVVVTVAVSHALFPVAQRTVSERRLAATSGALNLFLAPLGAMPMCHGAGGVAAHHRFGARGIGAPLVLAALCLASAAAGPAILDLLQQIPPAAIGALLALAALDLILTKRMFDARRDCQPVIAAATVATFAGGALIGLIAGLVAEALRRRLVRRRADPTPGANDVGR
ncbi:MAG: putative sulfate/molybdate transporter [Pseudomonadota bacterium]